MDFIHAQLGCHPRTTLPKGAKSDYAAAPFGCLRLFLRNFKTTNCKWNSHAWSRTASRQRRSSKKVRFVIARLTVTVYDRKEGSCSSLFTADKTNCNSKLHQRYFYSYSSDSSLLCELDKKWFELTVTFFALLENT